MDVADPTKTKTYVTELSIKYTLRFTSSNKMLRRELCSIKRPGVLLLPSQQNMFRFFQQFADIHLYTWVRSNVSCPRTQHTDNGLNRLEPDPLQRKINAPTVPKIRTPFTSYLFPHQALSSCKHRYEVLQSLAGKFRSLTDTRFTFLISAPFLTTNFRFLTKTHFSCWRTFL